MLYINVLIEALYPFHLHRGTVCLRVCLCLATDQKYSWEHVERQGCTEHAQMLSTGRWAQCYRYLHLFLCCLLSFSLTSFIMQIEHFAGNPPLPPTSKTNTILFPHLSSTYTYSEEQHQHLVFSPCFSNRTALILLDKGWESQENISVCAHVHTHGHTGISQATIHLHSPVQQNKHCSEKMQNM